MSNEEKILAMLEKLNGTVEKHGEMLAEIKAAQAKMQDDITSIKVRQDYDVDVRFKAMGEDFDVVKEKLGALESTVDEVKELAEDTRDKADVIHAVVSQHGAAITELKQVQ